MIINQISVFLENEMGQLSTVTGLLATNGIDVKALNIAETADYGILRLIVDDEDKAVSILIDNGFIISKNTVICACVPDCPGGLHNLLEKMAKNNINVEYMYSIVAAHEGEARMILKVDDPEKVNTII